MPSNNSGPNYDFILNAGQKPKTSLVPNLGFPKPLKIGLLVLVGLMVLIIASSVLGGHKGSSNTGALGLAARAQEIVRVSNSFQGSSNDPDAQALANTVSTVLTSQENQLTAYITSGGQKLAKGALDADQNSATDAALASAIQSHNLEPTYYQYLKNSLAIYKNDLSKEYSSTKSAKLKSILSSAYASVQTLLTSPKLH